MTRRGVAQFLDERDVCTLFRYEFSTYEFLPMKPEQQISADSQSLLPVDVVLVQLLQFGSFLYLNLHSAAAHPTLMTVVNL